MPTNMIILLILLGVAATAIILTLVFTFAVDRRLARERSGTGGEGVGEDGRSGPRDEEPAEERKP